ncbi:unnamed protein product [Litomosoides sigmodontis]|uniref:Protein kinase domain-containing protein n=1 Tax=Litomosoides sigmodontis TaxID=42156 RepID=A0A3P6U7Y5_LITSI|nr:unnamed protein product [Litomosoides sigmodontis]
MDTSTYLTEMMQKLEVLNPHHLVNFRSSCHKFILLGMTNKGRITVWADAQTVLRMASELPDGWNIYYTGVGIIGGGMYGTVYRSIDVHVGKMVSIKKVRANSTSEHVPSVLIREITMLKSMKHPNIVSCEDAVVNGNQSYVVYGFVCMNLKSYISRIPDGEWMDIPEQKLYLYQILQAISYCHGRNILHRNLKPENILIDQKGYIKLAEFRFDDSIYKQEGSYVNEDSDRFYKAPELLFGWTFCTPAVDMWSIGCVHAEMALKQALFTPSDSDIDQILSIFKLLSTPPKQTLRRLAQNCSETFPNWTNNRLHEILNGLMDYDGIKIVEKMLTYEPTKRISAENLLANLYFDDIDRTRLPTSE